MSRLTIAFVSHRIAPKSALRPTCIDLLPLLDIFLPRSSFGVLHERRDGNGQNQTSILSLCSLYDWVESERRRSKQDPTETLTMDPATIPATGVTAVGAMVSVVKTVKEIKDFIHDAKHVDEAVAQFCAEIADVEITLNLIKHTIQVVGSDASDSSTVLPQSAVVKSVDDCHSAARSLCEIFRALGKKKVVQELRLRSQSTEIAELRRRL